MKRDLLLILDTETTSNKPESARIVQIGAVLEEEGSDHPENVLINSFCNPEVQIAQEAAEVHGITNEMVKDLPIDRDTIRPLMDFIQVYQDRLILAGHNIKSFDMPILWRVARRAPLPIPILDTMLCAVRCLPDAPSIKLSELVKWLGEGSGEGAHDALADIRMVLSLVNRFSRDLGHDWESLAQWLGKPRVLKRCHFGKHKGKLWGKAPSDEESGNYVPGGYVNYISKQFDSMLGDVVLTIKHHYGITFRGEVL